MPQLSRTQIEKVLRAMAATGQDVDEVRVEPDGRVRFMVKHAGAAIGSRDVLDDLERNLGKPRV